MTKKELETEDRQLRPREAVRREEREVKNFGRNPEDEGKRAREPEVHAAEGGTS